MRRAPTLSTDYVGTDYVYGRQSCIENLWEFRQTPGFNEEIVNT
jgi:hypothetical protein